MANPHVTVEEVTYNVLDCDHCGTHDSVRVMTDHYGRIYNFRLAVKLDNESKDAPRIPGLYVPDGSSVTGWICSACGDIRFSIDLDDIYPADVEGEIPSE